MKRREIEGKVLQWAAEYPVVTITGPRQSGKTTLCKMLFPNKPYVSLEDPDARQFAAEDGKGFLARFAKTGCVLDEVQNAPQLLSWLQSEVDSSAEPGRFILSGSQNLLLMEAVSQSLAGRTALATLYPFTVREAYGEENLPDRWEMLLKGFYPRILVHGLNPREAFSFYISTYLERDIRRLVNVGDFLAFGNFLKICAGRSGQVLNYASISADAGVSANTVKHWLSVLETSYIVKLLPPWSANVNKQLVKSPKLYFLDTGLLCALLGIHTREQLETHPLRGSIFETFAVAEKWKRAANLGRDAGLRYYRDASKTEVDLVETTSDGTILTEIKSGMTYASDWRKPLEKAAKTIPNATRLRILYGSEELLPPANIRGIETIGWKQWTMEREQ